MEELCEDLTLKNLVIVTYRWSNFTHEAGAERQSHYLSSSAFAREVMRRGAKIYHCTCTSKPELGALRIILGGRSVAPEVQQEPINKGSESEQTAVRQVEPSEEKLGLGERHNSDIEELGGSTQEAVDKEVEELRRELEEQKMRAQHEAEEQKRRAQEEADGLRTCIAGLQSELEKDRHTSGKATDTYNFRHVPARSRVFLVGSLAHLA